MLLIVVHVSIQKINKYFSWYSYFIEEKENKKTDANN